MAFRIWWCKVGKFREFDSGPEDYGYYPLFPASVYAQFPWNKVAGQWENGIVKLRMENSEDMTVAQEADLIALGNKPENLGPCDAELIDYTDQYYADWTTWTTTTTTTTQLTTTTT